MIMESNHLKFEMNANIKREQKKEIKVTWISSQIHGHIKEVIKVFAINDPDNLHHNNHTRIGVHSRHNPEKKI